MTRFARTTTASRRARSPRARGRGRGARGGFITLLALVCVAVLVAGFAAMTRLVALERNGQRQEEFRAQAEWLAEAGLDRARARANGDPDWNGETWTIAAEEFDGRGDATVTIDRMMPENEDDDRGEIRAVAVYPAGATMRARAERRIVEY
ncbi:MAG: hypothetical protein WD066_04735 [Planctomycetaceae bacterium]